MAIFRAMATVGGWTAGSRLLGFLRDILIARVLGTGGAADAFFVAFRLPNLFRALLAEGAFNASFVPLFARRLEAAGLAAAVAFAEQAQAVLLVASLGLTLLAIATMPWLMHLLAPGFGDDPAQYALAVELARVTFPYLVFMCLTALFAGMLNSLRRYTAAAAAPTVLNLVMIAGLLVAPWVGDTPRVLAWSVTLAGLGQFLVLLVAARRAGIRPRLTRPRLTPEVRRLLVLMGPGLIAAGAMQLNLFVGTMVATLQDGAASVLYYADRVYQLPLALFGIALSVVLLPELTRRLQSQGEAAAREGLNRGLEYALLLTLPATVALMTIPLPIARALFERGAFTAADSVATALALFAYAAGLPAFVLTKVLQPAFFAREDTVTPLKAALVGVATNLMLAILLFLLLRARGYGFLGLAAATAIAAWVTCGILAWKLRRRGLLRPDRRLAGRLPRQLLAAVAMGLALWGGAQLIAGWLEGPSLGRFLGLALLVLLGGLVYFSGAWALGALRREDLARLRPRRRSA
jgi:putative peptidoglycan lipid II flippase